MEAQISLALMHHDVKGSTSDVSRRAANLYSQNGNAHTEARLGLSKTCRAHRRGTASFGRVDLK